MSAAVALVEIAAADPFALVRALNRMAGAGFALLVRDNRLVISPFSRLSEQQRAYLHAHKAALVSLLEDAETLHHALVVAGPAGLAWQAGTPADWDNTRLLAAGEVLYSDGRMASVKGRRYAIESAPPGPDISADIPIDNPAPPASPADPPPAPVDAKPTKAAPTICLPAEGYPFRLITKCDKPTPIYGPDGGDPLGCSHCGARWGAEAAKPGARP